jgi:hypothetical protein
MTTLSQARNCSPRTFNSFVKNPSINAVAIYKQQIIDGLGITVETFADNHFDLYLGYPGMTSVFPANTSFSPANAQGLPGGGTTQTVQTSSGTATILPNGTIIYH